MEGSFIISDLFQASFHDILMTRPFEAARFYFLSLPLISTNVMARKWPMTFMSLDDGR